MGSLNGKAAVVTGASKGIGAGIARALGAAGASVAVNYASDKEGADKVVADIARGGGKAVAIQGDLSKPADITRLFTEVQKAFGHLNILVNNAGVYKFLPLDQSEPEEFHRQFNINVLGTILAAREAARYFGPEGGSIINLSSVASRAAVPNSVIYSATKGAVDAVTRVLAAELGPRKIRVNTWRPGWWKPKAPTPAASSAANFTKRQKRQRRWAASASRTTSPVLRSSLPPTRRAG
jgi:3-oxoacyl-[acyl-carrier protein] reductase